MPVCFSFNKFIILPFQDAFRIENVRRPIQEKSCETSHDWSPRMLFDHGIISLHVWTCEYNTFPSFGINHVIFLLTCKWIEPFISLFMAIVFQRKIYIRKERTYYILMQINRIYKIDKKERPWAFPMLSTSVAIPSASEPFFVVILYSCYSTPLVTNS